MNGAFQAAIDYLLLVGGIYLLILKPIFWFYNKKKNAQKKEN